MYETDCDDYEYQQSRMEFAGPDDYDFETMYEPFESFNYNDYEDEKPIHEPDELESVDTLITTIQSIARKGPLSLRDKKRYFTFLREHPQHSNYSLNSIKELDSRLLVFLADMIVCQFGFKNWYDSLSKQQLEYIRKHIDNYPYFSGVKKMIILDFVDYDSAYSIYMIPAESSLGFKGYLLRNATKENFDEMVGLLPEIGKKEHRARNRNGRNNMFTPDNAIFESYDGVMNYIFSNHAQQMSKHAKLEFLKYILMYSTKDVVGNGRELDLFEKKHLKELLEKANVDKEFLKTNRKEYVDGIYETLYKNALNRYLDSDYNDKPWSPFFKF